LQSSNPAFSASFQSCDIFHREVEAHHLVEKSGSFRGGKPQIGGAQFGHLTARTVPRQGELWVLTRGDHQMHLGRQMFQ
jgi:hypothetical protein